MIGRAINVPSKVQKSIQILPRLSDETQTIPVALKRSMEHKQNYLYEAIRPAVIFKALDILKNCEVFKYLNIQIDKNRLINDMNSQPIDIEDDLLEESTEIITENDCESQVILNDGTYLLLF